MLRSDLKEKLAAGQVIFGPFFKLNCASLIEMIGYAGPDFVIIDNEHSNFSYPDMENLIRAADGVQLHTIIRVPSATEENLLHALDSGASGVQIPSLTSVAAVREAMPYVKYHPLGRRGMGTAQRAARFGFMEANAYFKAANENTLIVVHVENQEMVDQVEALCQVNGVDVLFAGPGDLSQAVGKPMQVNDPDVVAMVEKVIAKARKHRKYAGVWVSTAADAERYVRMGAQYIGFQADVGLIGNAFKEYARTLEQLRRPS